MITYTFKIKSTPALIEKFENALNVTRLVYNLAKEVKESAYKKGVSMSKFDLMYQLPELKKEFEFIKNVNAQTLQLSIDRLNNSYSKFFKGGGYPKWASKKRWKSVQYTTQASKLHSTYITISKIGNVRFFKSREIEGNFMFCRVLKKADGWYLQIITDHQIQKCDNQAELGIDRGVKYLAVTSDGQYFENIKTTEKYAKQLRIEQRSLARKKRLSKNWYKQVEIIQKLHLKISRAREDYLHKTSRELANNYQTIYLEDLNISGMLKNSNLSKSLHDVSWSKLENMLSYKANVVKVNSAYTSQDCSNCGNRDKLNRVSQSIFKCTSCSFEMNADENASLNILERGQSLLSLNVGQ